MELVGIIAAVVAAIAFLFSGATILLAIRRGAVSLDLLVTGKEGEVKLNLGKLSAKERVQLVARIAKLLDEADDKEGPVANLGDPTR